MAHLISRDKHPPGGFRFLQPQTNWKAPEWQSFSVTVANVIAHRRGNPPLTEQHGLSVDTDVVAQEVDAYNAAICKANNWTEYYAEDDSPKPFRPTNYQPLKSAVDVAAGVKNTVVGVKAMQEWLGLGLKPTEQTTAENRAVICANCDRNVDPNWLQKIDAAAASLVKGLIEAKNKMALATAQDAHLNTCSVCDCYLRLKVWSPRDVVHNNTSPEIRAKLPSHCWVIREAAEAKI